MLEDYGADAERDDEFAEGLMLRHGIPRDVVTALRAVSRSFRAWGGTPEVDARRWPTAASSSSPTARWRSSTARATRPADTIFHDAERGERARRRPPDRPHLLQPADLPAARRQSGEPGGGRPRALIIYMRSLRETREMDRRLILPGHGEPVTDHVALIDERFACTSGARARSPG